MSSSKKFSCKRTLRLVFYMSEAQNPIPLPPLHTAYEYTLCVVIHTGKGEGGGGEMNQRKG